MPPSMPPRLVLPALCLAGLASWPRGQEPPPPPDAARPAGKPVEEPAQEPARESAEDLVRQFEEARDRRNAGLRRAREENDAAALERLRRANPAAEFAPRFEAAAAAAAGTAAAVPFLVWLAGHAPREAGAAAIATVMADHRSDPRIAHAVARLSTIGLQLGVDRVEQHLAAVLACNEDAGVRAQAHYTRASLHVGTRAARRSEELRAQAVADLRAVLAAAPDASLQRLATDLLYEAEHLEPGLPAPEIAGEDLDGTPFELSDYRGKVVLLDFWGDW